MTERTPRSALVLRHTSKDGRRPHGFSRGGRNSGDQSGFPKTRAPGRPHRTWPRKRGPCYPRFSCSASLSSPLAKEGKRGIERFSKTTLATAILLVCLWCTGCERHKKPTGEGLSSESASARPNVLLVTFDTTRADRLSCYGNAAIRTPTIDALAAKGVRYTRCYAAAPITLPSHTTLLTGLYPVHHRLRDNGAGRLDDNAVTLAESFQSAGYQTGAVVGAVVLDARYGLNQGFDSYDDRISETHPATGLHFAERPASTVTDAATQWLDTLDDDPFFLWVHYFDPHSPYAPPGLRQGATEQEAYDAEIAYTDAELGRLVAQVERRDAANGTKTLVVFTADHGESLHEHGEWTHGLFVYNATIQVPLIVTTLGDDAVGMVVDTPVSLVDVMPSLIKRLGIDEPYGLDGVRLPKKRATSQDDSRAIYFETQLPHDTYGWSALEGVVLGEKKYIAAPTPELYNVVTDPTETTNLLAAGAQPDARFVHALRDAKKSAPDTPVLSVGESGSDARVLRQLAALGYVGGARPSQDDTGPLADPKTMVELHDKATRASMRIEGRQWSVAAGLIREVLSKDPNNFWVLDMLIKLLQQPEAFSQASDVARWRLQSPLRPPWDEQLPAAVGLAAARAGQGAATLDMLQSLVEKKPRSVDLRGALAAVLMQTGKSKEARPHLEAALAADPDNAMALSGLGDLALLEGNTTEAIQRYEAVIRGDSAGADVFAKLGQAYESSGQMDQALRAYRDAIAKDENMVDVRLALAGLLARRRRQAEAIEHYREVARQRPDDATVQYDTGLAFAGLQQFDAARRHFQKAVDLKPDFGDALINLGTVLVQQKDLSAAETVLTKAKAIDAVAAEARYMLGVAAARRGAIDETVKLYEEAIAIKPEYFAPIDELSNYYLLNKRTADAVRILNIGVTHAPDNVTLLARLAKILATSSVESHRDGATALTLSEHANQLAGNSRTDVLAALAAAQAETGNFPDAVTTAEHAIDLAARQGDKATATELRAALQLYKVKKPYRNPNF